MREPWKSLAFHAKVQRNLKKKASPGISLIQGGMTSHGWQMAYGSQSSPMLSHWCRSPQSGAFSIASRRDHRGNARSTVRGRGGCWEWSLVMVKTTKASQISCNLTGLRSIRNCRFSTTCSFIFGKFYGDFVHSFGKEKAKRWLHWIVDNQICICICIWQEASCGESKQMITFNGGITVGREVPTELLSSPEVLSGGNKREAATAFTEHVRAFICISIVCRCLAPHSTNSRSSNSSTKLCYISLDWS